jgi:uncharacterized membrane protein YedE/YeeE
MGEIPYAPWWAVALLLGAVTVGHWVFLRRLLGVSGILQRLAFLSESRAKAKAEALMPASQAELEAALLAETLAEFGPRLAAAGPGVAAAELAPPPPPAKVAASGAAGALEPSLAACTVFLLAIVAGGTASGALHGRLGLDLGPSAALERLCGSPACAWAALVGGGFLVGLGTSLCGGCSSGHGLSGCSRLQPGSLLSTALFMGAAILVSLAIAGRL